MGRDGERWGVMGSDGERWGAADEALLARPLLTSCCAAWFLTGCGPVPVRGPGIGDPCFRPLLPETRPRRPAETAHIRGPAVSIPLLKDPFPVLPPPPPYCCPQVSLICTQSGESAGGQGASASLLDLVNQGEKGQTGAVVLSLGCTVESPGEL